MPGPRNSLARGPCRWALAAIVCLALPAPARAQSIFERLGLDRLRFSGIGFSYGAVLPHQVVATQSYGIWADYGQVARGVSVVFGATYWGSRFQDAVVQNFVRQLRSTIVDPSGDDTLRADKVRISDIALEADVRWTRARRAAVLRPYLGGGIGVHVVNAESKLIQGTFVESAFDNISSGLTGLAGLELHTPRRRLAIGAEARYTFLTNVRFATFRATASYRFGFAPSTGSP